MLTQELLVAEVSAIAHFMDLLGRRRAAGEMGSLYAEVIDAADTIMDLRNDAPAFLQPELGNLQSRCSVLLRFIAQ